MSETMSFQTEVSRLLDIVANALYTEREIFLRELVSNAADACDRLRYDAIQNPALAAGDADYKIRVTFDTGARTLTVADNGVGMNRDDLINNLGTIAHSGTRQLVEQLKNSKDEKGRLNLIGQFGVGFYAAFMVADKVTVLSRKAGEDAAWQWSSDGRGAFDIDAALKDARGTEITLHLKDDAGEFLLEERLTQVVKKYSDHIGFPVIIGTGDAPANAGTALWMKNREDVSADDYKAFYRTVSDTIQIDEPWMTLHWRAEGAMEYTNLLFIPAMKPFDLYDPRRHHGVRLYVRRVFITQGVENLVPPFLRFVKGVVDSEDLPLNISREMLQSSPMVAKMSSAITRKILSELEKRAKDDPESFAAFWALFGPVVKEGLYDAHAHRDQLCRVAHFYSTHGEGLTTLDDYIGRMRDGQKNIYYISAPSVEAARHAPQLEAFRAKGVEVLFMTDTVDEFWLPIQDAYKEKKLKSVTRGATDLSAIAAEKDTDAAGDATSGDAAADEGLIRLLKDALTGEVMDVKASERLVDSPVCLVAPESGVDVHMQRILKKQQHYEAAQHHILEVNMKHPVLRRLAALAANDAPTPADHVLVKDTALLLLDQARIIEGEPLPNPQDFVRRMSQAIEKGLLGGAS